MALEVVTRQATTRSNRTGEPFEEALEHVQRTEVGRQLRKLTEGSHRDQSALQWQQDLPSKRAKERRQTRQEERRLARLQERILARLVAWKEFMQAERRELELRRNGQLARMLGEQLPGEPTTRGVGRPTEARRQAEEGLVALMHAGEVFYKHIKVLTEGDMPARI